MDFPETERAVQVGYKDLRAFNQKARDASRDILTWCARENKPCVLVLGRPYHSMDPGIGHEIEADLRGAWLSVEWLQYLPIDKDLMDWLFGEEVAAKKIRSPLDISDVWTSSNSSNTNGILWGAKFATRFPGITCVLRLSSYECGMDQPTLYPLRKPCCRGHRYFLFERGRDPIPPSQREASRSASRPSFTTWRNIRRRSSRKSWRCCRRCAHCSRKKRIRCPQLRPTIRLFWSAVFLRRCLLLGESAPFNQSKNRRKNTLKRPSSRA